MTNNQDLIIFESKNFTIEIHPMPFVSREDGGHLRIFPKDKERISDRRDFTKEEAIEFMLLSMMSGEALEKAMNKRGIPVVKINYEDLGNWAFKREEKPVLHLHIFGRAKNAKKQIFPEAVYLPDRSSGFYDGFEPLNKDDITAIKEEIKSLLKTDKYNKETWII
jgi:diadenosine tetraphosphate (Ap4A) HIT family hydrolase